MIRWIKSNFQGVVALIIATVVFFFLGPILEGFDSTAGTVDLGSLHVLAFGSVRFLFCTFLAWSVLQLDWKILDRYIDKGILKDDWKEACPRTRINALILVFGILLIAAIFSCK